MARGVTKWVPARLGGPHGPVLPTTLIYRRDQPWEVAARFHGSADWMFARDLLTAGLHASIGQGDVRVAPASDGCVRLELHGGQNGAERAAFYLPTHSVGLFLVATSRVVPYGAESHYLDLDSLCDALRRVA